MSDQANQIFNQVTGNVDVVKKIMSKVPGFKGYIDRQARRDSDKLIRDMLFNRFRELEGRVSGLQRDFGNRGEYDYIDDLERTSIKLRTFADRIRTATRGYSSLFEAVKINEDALAKIYQYDSAMLDLVDEVGRAIENVEASIGSEGLPAAVRNLETAARRCIETFDRREEVLITTATGAA
jgi:hypothetical protein